MTTDNRRNSDMIHLDNSNFDGELSSRPLVLVDFWAPWCGPCRALGSILEQISPEVEHSVTIGKVNIDENPELAERFGVQSIPTLIFFKNGAEVRRIVGLVTKADLMTSISAM